MEIIRDGRWIDLAQRRVLRIDPVEKFMPGDSGWAAKCPDCGDEVESLDQSIGEAIRLKPCGHTVDRLEFNTDTQPR